MKKIIPLVILLIATTLLLTACNNDPSKITLSEFNSLKEGISYREAVNIIGGSGTLISEAGSGEFKTIMYVWEGSGSTGANANAMFQNDKLITKAQFGLK